jgi:hypothetical protein
MNLRQLYDHAKADPNSIVMDMGEPNPLIISENHALCEMEDGSTVMKTLYVTFEYAKRHLKDLRSCDCDACQATLEAYRHNKKAFRGLTPKQMEALGSAEPIDAEGEGEWLQ